MASVNPQGSKLTYATYASRSSSKAANATLSTSATNTRPSHCLGLTPYTAESLEELITWRLLQLYRPFLPGRAAVAQSFFHKTSLRHVNASRLYQVFTSEFRVRQNSALSNFARARRMLNSRAQEDSEVFDTIARVAADAGVSYSTIEKCLKLLRDFSEPESTTGRSVAQPTATAMAEAGLWDDLARDLSEDHHALNSHNNAISRIVRHRARKIGISASRDLLPAVKRCRETYFSKLVCGTDVRTHGRFDPDYIEYMVAPRHQPHDNVGVHMLVQLKKAGFRKKMWKRTNSYVEVHPEDRQCSRSRTTRDSCGTHNPLRRLEARQERGPREPAVDEDRLVDPLRQLKVGEEYGDVVGRPDKKPMQVDSGAFLNATKENMAPAISKQPGRHHDVWWM